MYIYVTKLIYVTKDRQKVNFVNSASERIIKLVKERSFENHCFHVDVRSEMSRRRSERRRRKKIDDWRVVKHGENEPRSIKVAQLVQWGGAPAALARDTELRNHAKRDARGAPCTSLASLSLLFLLHPSRHSISPPLYALRTALHPFRTYATSSAGRFTRN